MASRKTTKRRRKAAQDAAKKRNTINAVIIIAVTLAVIWIATSAQDKTAAPPSHPADSQPVEPPPADAQPAENSAPVAEGKTYDSAPPMSIDTNVIYLATVKMANGGEFVIQLYADKSPITVNSFVFLAREGFFDGITFHRVLEGFMAQGGDPTGTGAGGPGYEFVNENSDLTFDKEGVVAMANAGPDTNGSQFFITFGPTPQLNGGYTIFGQITEGMDIVHGITRRDPQRNPDFEGDMIESITISEE
ncbi:MAG: peptidylprolyl isomerase [Chloroflexi bacterium]|nr:peptidylprolyl isomerase [Chloroflexota bacterium]